MHFKNTNGFSIIELITVVAIIVVLITLASTAALNARLRAYRTQAYTEAQQLATAFRAYYATYKEWPQGFAVGGSYVDLTEANLESLMGVDLERPYVFLEIPPERFENDMLVDPWGKPYKVKIVSTPIEPEETYRIVVTFPSRERYFYQPL